MEMSTTTSIQDRTTKVWTTKTMVKVSLLSAIAAVLMFIQIPVPFAPPFLKVDLGDLPALIGGFALGSTPGICIVLLKNVLNLIFKGTTTAYVGELSNFVVGSVYVVIASYIYRKHKTKRMAIFAMVVGVIGMTIVATLSNYLVIFPLYAKLYGMPIDQIISMGSGVNSLVTDYKTLMVFAIVPFNLVKGFVVSLITLLLYKHLSPILHRK